MTVRLISVTQPRVEGIETAEELLSFVARVSNKENQLNTATSAKLIKYLLKHKHFSPFEMINVSIEIATTRDISRQIIRHRSFSFSEWSQRYSALDADSFSEREARLQDPKNRQNSIEVDEYSDEHYDFLHLQDKVIELAFESYKKALEMGIAKEQARSLLPEGLTNTTLIVNGTLRSWLHYIELRKGVETQKEHRTIALECLDVLRVEFPVTCEAYFKEESEET